MARPRSQRPPGTTAALALLALAAGTLLDGMPLDGMLWLCRPARAEEAAGPESGSTSGPSSDQASRPAPGPASGPTAGTPPGPASQGKPKAAESPQDALDKALEALDESPAPPPVARAALNSPSTPASPPPSSDIYSRAVGSANLRLIDISFDALFAAGASTQTDESLQDLQGGGHDPRKRGFTVQNVELSLMGAVDPYLSGEAHIVYFIEPLTGESKLELEEAFLTTQQLPWGFQLKAGQFQTEFGRINPQHPHQWEWLDQPIVNTRFFGPDGMRSPGLRLGWLSPLPWYSEILGGIQNANGETMSSFLASEGFFEERPIGGRPFTAREVRALKDLAYLVRWDNGFDVTDEIGAKGGLSLLYGPNATGPNAYTRIYGADLVVKWRPVESNHGWPFVIWQSEIMKRDYQADEALVPGEVPAEDLFFPRAMLRDWGFYTQVLYGFWRSWAVGLRYEFAGAEGASGGRVRQEDPFRDDRHRIAPLIAWQPTEFSRLRLQYNYDNSKHLESDEAHSVWAGVEILFGSHPAHKY